MVLMFSVHFAFFAQLICPHPTEVPFTYPRQVVFFVKFCNQLECVNTLFVDLSLVGMRTLPYGFLAAFDPVSPTSAGNHTDLKPFILTYLQALINAVRELLGKNKSRSSTKAPIEFAENPQLPGTASTTSGAEAQSRPNMESTSIGEIVVRENVNEDGERGVGVEKMGQDLEECNLEFPIIERQL